MVSAKELGITVVKASGDEEYCLCPFHEDRSPSASFNKVKGLLYCYVCGRGWNLVQLQDALGVDITMHQDEELPDFDLMGESFQFDLGETIYHSYFKERKVLPSIWNIYGVRWKSSEPEAAVLPIRDYSKNVKGVAYRYMTGSTRYKVFGETTPVWPMHLMRYMKRDRKIVVVEGAWSAMRIASVNGFKPLPLALMGAKANQAIVDVLQSFDVTFLYDQDEAGERACAKMKTLFPLANCFTVSPSPDDMNERQIAKLLAQLP